MQAYFSLDVLHVNFFSLRGMNLAVRHGHDSVVTTTSYH